MAKKKIQIINMCGECSDNIVGACWHYGFDNERDFTEDENYIIANGYFPDWCPLEDYKNGNENE